MTSRSTRVSRRAHAPPAATARRSGATSYAGVGAFGPFERMPLADHVQASETNLLGTPYGAHDADRRFLEQAEAR